ncbi:MAG TPA: hypothetical protein VLS90_08935 [Thermodesulfobacteriota bacterium]|nr:hypothetical protein [Thermodesulfobacteriota bacterium]
MIPDESEKDRIRRWESQASPAVQGKGIFYDDTESVYSWESFVYLLDEEVKKGKRYDLSFSILKMTLSPVSGNRDDQGLKTCFDALVHCSGKELRESDILGFMGEFQLGVILPQTDATNAAIAQSRLMERLNFRNRGYELKIDRICFPADGSNIIELMSSLRKKKGSG